VARLEHAVKSMHSMLTRNGAEAGNTAPERDAAEALNSLQSDTTLNGHTSSDPSSIYSNYNENAPLLSMFDNAVVSTSITCSYNDQLLIMVVEQRNTASATSTPSRYLP
jgi:hypothetical protein